MFRRFEVNGMSMEPTYREGDRIIAVRYAVLLPPRRGDTAIVRDPRNGKLLLKRIVSIENGGMFRVRGDNDAASTDSREFGLLSREHIVAKVFWRYHQKKER